MPEFVWTTENFDELSWHDNHVHALRIVEGDYGAGQLVLELDYILDWQNSADGSWQFILLPCRLTFMGVTRLRIALDYESPAAGLCPFSLHCVERWFEKRERYVAQLWRLDVNWPQGDIRFEADGFEQRGLSQPALSDGQYLAREQRDSLLRATTGGPHHDELP